ncbi:uncharacterized protein Dwil_GK27813 [Drosophila willistoni]|uniref:Uncharacterized protein n=1 Tax=Drosophila willistoni TaxID=7260 RepID=A0A0Q9X445_DROWI|nr:uncharacterized protein Dwil_GK27813 [Drosophila willistoni]
MSAANILNEVHNEPHTDPYGTVDSTADANEKRLAHEEWINKNSQPKKRVIPRVEREPTRWQKKGPMKKKQWKQFFEWAQKNAVPYERKLPEVTVPCAADYLPCGKEPRAIDRDDLLERMDELSTPLPHKMTPKYKSDKNVATYSPVIEWGQPPMPQKGRPFLTPKVPCCFPNDEVEQAFWFAYRFPIRKEALNGHASPRIINLAKPRVMPPFPPHCPIPERPPATDPLDGPAPKRKKFTPRQWRLHQIRLIYLSKPVTRPQYDYFYM